VNFWNPEEYEIPAVGKVIMLEEIVIKEYLGAKEADVGFLTKITTTEDLPILKNLYTWYLHTGCKLPSIDISIKKTTTSTASTSTVVTTISTAISSPEINKISKKKKKQKRNRKKIKKILQ